MSADKRTDEVGDANLGLGVTEAALPPQIPARMLVGLTTHDGWRIDEQLAHIPAATGGFFSVGYIVRREPGEEGFLKALDFVTHLQKSNDVARDLQEMTTAFNFERTVLEACKGMSRVVTAMSSGSITVPSVTQFGPVQYLIFELAHGDIRRVFDAAATFDVAWALRSLHHVAVGLFQMHKASISHQDLKPSNVLVFENGSTSKIADLGRAVARHTPGPFDEYVFAGDRGYAPPELLYGAPPVDWNVRRLGCDAYHLGSIITFYFTHLSMTPLLNQQLAPAHRYTAWSDPYADVLPFVRAAFEKAMEIVRREIRKTAGNLTDELVQLVRDLCDPEPERRGHPQTSQMIGTPRAMERVISKLEMLCRKAELRVKQEL